MRRVPTAVLMLLVLPGLARSDGVDLYGDPLPPGAVARMGTQRWRVPHDFELRMSYSPDGKMLFAVSNRGVLRLDSGTGQAVSWWTVENPGEVISAFRPDLDRIILVDLYENAVVLREASSGKLRLKIEKAQGKLSDSALSPDGKILATRAYRAGTVCLWDTGTGKEIRRLTAVEREPNAMRLPRRSRPSLAFSPDGKLAAVSEYGDLAVWDIRTGRRELERRDFSTTSNIMYMSFSSDGNWLVWWEEYDEGLHLWYVAPGPQRGRSHRILSFSRDAFAGFLFSPDGALVTSECDHSTGTLHFWDLVTLLELERVSVPWSARSFCFSPDGRTLSFVDGQTVRNRTRAGAVRTAPPGRGSCPCRLAWTPDGSSIVAALVDGSIGSWDARTGERLRTLREELAHGSQPMFALSPDGRTIAVKERPEIRLLDAQTSRPLRRLESSDPNSHRIIGEMVWLTDGKVLLDPTGEEVRRWATTTGRELPTLKLAREESDRRTAQILGLGADGLPLFLEDHDEEGLWLRHGNPARYLHAVVPEPRIAIFDRDVALSADGRVIALVPFVESYLSLRESLTGQEIGRIDLSTNLSVRSALTPDGSVLALAVEDGPIRLYRVGEDRPFRELLGHWGKVTALAFSPDGTMLLSGAEDTTMLVWYVSDQGPAPSSDPTTSVERCWADLAGNDARAARRAMDRLAAMPGTTDFLKKALQPIPIVDADLLAARIADLDSDAFDRRQQAERDLLDWGEQVEPALRRLLDSDGSVEARLRAERVLRTLDLGPETAQEVRRHRALAVLERIGTPEAKEVLRDLACGAPGAQQTREAVATLQRLQWRVADPRRLSH
jgi:WD40 repeat protein